MVLTEYDEQAHIKNEREIALEEGRAEGRAEGEARLASFTKLMQNLLEAGKVEDAKKAATDVEYRKKLFEEYGLKE